MDTDSNEVNGKVGGDLPLPCGCTYTATFTIGDRRHQCGHGRVWIIRANIIRTVNYNISEKVEVGSEEG